MVKNVGKEKTRNKTVLLDDVTLTGKLWSKGAFKRIYVTAHIPACVGSKAREVDLGHYILNSMRDDYEIDENIDYDWYFMDKEIMKKNMPTIIEALKNW